MIVVTPASSPQQIDAVRQLIEEYASCLQIDLEFQGFTAELAGLAGLYAPPRGCLLLAVDDLQSAAGCVAVRPLDETACEMKRLYVRPAFRGHGLGKLLAIAAIEAAKVADYQVMRLDTLPTMSAAIALYEALGFTRSPAYYETPFEDTVFLELSLR